MTPPELAAILTGTYQMPPAWALQAAATAARLGLDCEPVPGGYIEITAVPAPARPGSYDYEITPHDGPRPEPETSEQEA